MDVAESEFSRNGERRWQFSEEVSVVNVDVVDVMVQERKKGGCFRVVKLLVLSTKEA